MKKIKRVFVALLLIVSFLAGSYLTITRPAIWVNFWKLKKFDCINPYGIIKTYLQTNFKDEKYIIYPIIESPNNWTALDQLENTISNKIKGKGVNAFITEINGYSTEGKKEYWAFYTNQEYSSVGVQDYIVEKPAKLEFKLETISE